MAKAKAKAKDEVVAFIVGWSLRQARGPYDCLQELAEELGLGQYLPAPPSYEARLRRALARAKNAYGISFRRVGEKGGGKAIYRPTGKPEAGRPAGKGLVLNRSLGGLRLEDPRSSLLQAVRVDYEATAGLYSHETVGGWLHRVLERSFHATPFPATGGAHVVPAGDGARERLEALQLAVQTIGSSSFDFEALRGETALARNAALGLLESQWSTMVKELEGFVDEVAAGGLTHPTAYTAKLAQAEALRQRVALYGRVLGQERRALVAAIEGLEASARALLSATTEARALRKARGSETAARLAQEAVAVATEEARGHLAEASKAWAPVSREETD